MISDWHKKKLSRSTWSIFDAWMIGTDSEKPLPVAGINSRSSEFEFYLQVHLSLIYQPFSWTLSRPFFAHRQTSSQPVLNTLWIPERTLFRKLNLYLCKETYSLGDVYSELIMIKLYDFSRTVVSKTLTISCSSMLSRLWYTMRMTIRPPAWFRSKRSLYLHSSESPEAKPSWTQPPYQFFHPIRSQASQTPIVVILVIGAASSRTQTY